MLTLNDGRSELWQWDTGRTLTVDADCSQVHFSNKVFGRSIDVDVIGGAAIIPDVLLQTDNDLSVWAFVGTADNGYTKISKTFKVNRRNKPADYVFTPVEQTTIAELVEEIGNLDELTTEAKDNLVAAINEAAKSGGSGGSGTTDHTRLTNRDADDQHPMSAITGLVGALDGKMDSNNPVGSGSFSMGRKSGTAVGYNSHAEGYDTTASDSSSHAEGDSTTASGGASHAEGSSTTASGGASHAEGSSTTASGDASHAEGVETTASGDNSHVQGKYNIEDSSNLYAHIVGNGTSDTARSNAHTLDWSGNAWFAGDVFVGSASGTNKDAGSKKLATEEYVNNEIADCIKAPATAKVGQTIVVKAVDENGQPTEWEAADVGGWDLIANITLTEDGGGATLKVTRNDKGEDFEYRQCMVCLSGKVIDGWPKGASQYIHLYENNEATGRSASVTLSRLAAGEGGTDYKTTVEMSIFGNLVRLIACGGSADTSSIILRSEASIDTFRSISLSCYGNNQWTSVPLAAGGRVVIYGRK